MPDDDSAVKQMCSLWPGRGACLEPEAATAPCWGPPASAPGSDAARVTAAARALVATITTLGDPDGFGALLAGRGPAFPLSGAVKVARALARACADDDPDAALAAAEPLLGLGPGLT